MSEFRVVQMGIISLEDSLSSGRTRIMNAFIRNQGGLVLLGEYMNVHLFEWKDCMSSCSSLCIASFVSVYFFVHFFLHDMHIIVRIWLFLVFISFRFSSPISFCSLSSCPAHFHLPSVAILPSVATPLISFCSYNPFSLLPQSSRVYVLHHVRCFSMSEFYFLLSAITSTFFINQ